MAVKKMQYATTGKTQTLLFITPEKARKMAGVPWMQATEAQGVLERSDGDKAAG